MSTDHRFSLTSPCQRLKKPWKGLLLFLIPIRLIVIYLASVQTLDSTIHWINHSSADKYCRNQLDYPLDSIRRIALSSLWTTEAWWIALFNVCETPGPVVTSNECAFACSQPRSSSIFWSKPRVVIVKCVQDFKLTCYCFCSFSIVPESPRWLVLQGHVKAACKVLMKFSSNKRSTPTDPDLLRSQLESLHRSETNPHAQSRNVNHSPLDLLRTPRMRKRTLIFWFNW